jgi:hypothetical protein
MAATGKTGGPGKFIADAELEPPLVSVVHGFLCGFDDRALDAAAGNRTRESAVVAHDDLTACRTRRGAPCFHHRSQRDPVPGGEPVFRGLKNVVLGRRHHGDPKATSTTRFAITVTRCALVSTIFSRSGKASRRLVTASSQI